LLSPQLKRANLGAEFDGIDGIVRKIASDEYVMEMQMKLQVTAGCWL
jgi:hypothetical protein